MTIAGTVTTSSNLALSDSISSRYEEIIDISPVKQIHRSLFSLLSYFDNYAVKAQFLVNIISFIRIMQLVVPSFMITDIKFYDHESLCYKTMSIVSMLAHVLPASSRNEEATIYLWCYIVLTLGFLIALIYFAVQYKKTSQIPMLAANALSLITVSFAFILLPPAAQLSCEILSGMISKVNRDKDMTTFNLFTVIVSMIFFVLLAYLLMQVYTRTLMFRSCSLITVESKPQAHIILVTTFITVVTALTCKLIKGYGIAAIVLSIIAYTIPIIDLYTKGSCILEKHQKLLLASCLTGILNLIIKFVLLFMNVKMTVPFLFTYIGTTAISLFAAEFLIRKKTTKQLLILDEYDETGSLDHIDKPEKFCCILSTGFTYLHPSCISYNIFNTAVAKWENSLPVWTNYAKFASIYPENVGMLTYIQQNIVSHRFRDTTAEAVISDIKAILKTRETNLSVELKGQINKTMKLITKAKNRLRNIWDLVLQNNIADIEKSVHDANDSVEKAQKSVNHLLMLYPNNRFIARLNGRFLHEVLSDKVGARKWSENARILQRGGRISEDTVHNLALAVYPELPLKISDTNSNFVNIVNDDQSELGDIFDESDDETIDGEAIIANMIDKHKVPAIRTIIASYTLFLVIVVLVPIITLLVMFRFISVAMLDPLPIMLGVTTFRVLLNLETSITATYIISNLPDPYNPAQTMMRNYVIPQEIKMDAFGGYRDLKSVCSFIMKRMVAVVEQINPLKNYMVGDANIDNARNAMFGQNVLYWHTRTPTDRDKYMLDIETFIGYFTSHLAKILAYDNITDDVVKSVSFRTIMNNYDNPSVIANQALQSFIDYIKEYDTWNQNFYKYLMFALIVAALLIFVIVIVVQFKSVKRDKQVIYGSLSYLPKTVVSNISQSFWTVRKDDTTSSVITRSTDNERAEMNKQEENVIKIFNSISDNSGSNNGQYVSSFLFFLTLLCACLGYYFTCFCYRNISTITIESAPQLNYLLGSFSRMCSSFTSLLSIVIQHHNPDYALYANETKRVEFAIQKLHDFNTFFSMARFGGSASNEYPFTGMKDRLEAADKIIVCKDKYAPPQDYLSASSCFDAEGQTYLILTCFSKFFTSIPDVYPKPRGDNVAHLFYSGPIFLSESFFSPAMNILVPTITKEVRAELKPLIIKTVIIIICAIILTISSIILAVQEEKYLKFMLRMFLFCGSKTVLQYPKILNLLNGHYHDDNDDSVERTSEFYNNVTNKLAEVIAIVKAEDSTIISLNASFLKTFKVEEDELIGTNIHEFFKKDCFIGEFENILKEKTDVIYALPDGDKSYYTFTATIAANNLILSGRDQTLRVNHENLIAEEKKKSDQMLSSILPPSLVPRVQAGEKNISFSVQSVSVLFLDIVEFTPWCGSNQPQYVMKMLNTIFKEMDALTSLHNSVTRIKCIGDCYMAAGGIFDEVNQPAVHSKETVEFGCEAIKKIEEIDAIYEEKLRIRVGVNTGGPIVVGVLGTDKPTFEILGPTINIAQQMEHHGVPMNVHISRSVYELIYGGNFSVKERGEIEVKSGKMFTYLVEP